LALCWNQGRKYATLAQISSLEERGSVTKQANQQPLGALGPPNQTNDSRATNTIPYR